MFSLNDSSPDLLQSDWLFDLLVIIRVLPARRQLLERFREDLALVVPGASHSFI